jgi:hypothetical protein
LIGRTEKGEGHVSGNWMIGGGCGLAPCRSAEAGKRKGLRVLVGGGPEFAARVAGQFDRIGWEVCAATEEKVPALSVRKNPAAVLLPVEGGVESGYLACAKLRIVRPKLRVVLVGERTPRAERFARFVGASLADEATAADAVLKLI